MSPEQIQIYTHSMRGWRFPYFRVNIFLSHKPRITLSGKRIENAGLAKPNAEDPEPADCYYWRSYEAGYRAMTFIRQEY